MTNKQEIFCKEVIKQNNYSDAYRVAYDTSNMTDKSVNELASTLMKNVKVASRVSELKNKIENKELYTIEKSIKRDLSLIKRYEAALDVLENKESKSDDIDAAERMIKFIGVGGYNSAQDRLSKQHGFYFEHNKQKKPESSDIDYSKYSVKELQELQLLLKKGASSDED